jgi:gluconokinase
MRAGVPLDDRDRAPWLARLNAELRTRGAQGRPTVLACSALKASYRDRLLEGVLAPRLVHLRGDPALIAVRLAARTGHYMSPALLVSQYAALEVPGDAVEVDVADSPEAIAAEVLQQLGASRTGEREDGMG